MIKKVEDNVLPHQCLCGLGLQFGKMVMKRRVRKIFRRSTGTSPIDIRLSEINIPDSQLTRQVTELVREVSPTSLYNHCLRSYIFAELLGQRDKLKYDREVLYLSSIMHDLGLTTRYEGSLSFEVEGANSARKILLSYGYSKEKSDLVREAIALHTAVGIASKRSPEIALVHFGAGVDVVGIRINDISKRTVHEVVEQFPRLNFKDIMTKLMINEVKLKPKSHMSGLVRLGFNKAIIAAPFPE